MRYRTRGSGGGGDYLEDVRVDLCRIIMDKKEPIISHHVIACMCRDVAKYVIPVAPLAPRIIISLRSAELQL
jgi:hypothetical protein